VRHNHSLDEKTLGQLLQAQHGVVARRQALACGMTNRMLQHRLRIGGPWTKLLTGVYVTVTGTVSAEQREIAALLYAGPQSILTGAAAARRHGLGSLDRSTVDVLVPATQGPKDTSFVRVWRTHRMPSRVCVDGEVRYALPDRAVADAARSLRSSRDVRALVAQAIQRQTCSIAALDVELEQGPVKGSAPLRAALVEVRDGTRSAPEGDLRTLLRRARVPMPVFNARLYAGKTLIAVADAWWPDAGVVAEVDSRQYHYSAEDWQGTMQRHDRLVAHGVLLLHFTPRQIRTAPDEVVAQIRAALAAGRGRSRLPITHRTAA
jgi:very-short-patch-repair endonuclease